MTNHLEMLKLVQDNQMCRTTLFRFDEMLELLVIHLNQELNTLYHKNKRKIRTIN